MAGVKIDFDAKAIRARVQKGIDKSVAPLMEQVLKDSNYYCRQDQVRVLVQYRCGCAWP